MKKKKMSEAQATFISAAIASAAIIIAVYILLKADIAASRESREAREKIEVIKSHYTEKNEVVDYIKKASTTGVGYDYKAYFPNGEIEYIQFDGEDVNVILNVENEEGN